MEILAPILITKNFFDDQVLNIEYEPDTDAYEIIFEQDQLPTVENNFNMILDYNINDMTVENKIKFIQQILSS